MIDVSHIPPFIKSLGLNNIQQDAVLYNDGPQLVFAGAGTGKTRVLTAKIAFLIREVGFYPEQIFAATFTNKAAGEMRERVEELIQMPCKGLWIGTFHSLCARILRREAKHIGYDSVFTIYDSSDQLSLVKKLLKKEGIDERIMHPKHLLGSISRFKNSCKPYEEVESAGCSLYEREIIRMYGVYQKALKDAVAMDFDDLITNTVYLLRRHGDILSNYQKLFQYVLVDEYQDTNFAQFNLVQLLARAHHRIFVVGDDDQSIYSWRGAIVENILSFDEHFQGTKTFKLEQNYRSSHKILDFANEIITQNNNRAQKRLWSDLSNKSDVVVSRFRDDRQESLIIAKQIGELIQSGTKACDVAILFRTNAQSRSFEDSLRKRNIPYVLVGGTSFYERKEIKNCLAYLRLLVNPSDSLSCARILNVPARGIGAKSQEKIAFAAEEAGVSLLKIVIEKGDTLLTGKASTGLADFRELMIDLTAQAADGVATQDILSDMLTLTGYMDLLEDDDSEESRSRIENINELLNAVTIWHNENIGKTLTDFLEEISLASDLDKWNKKELSVNLMTFHASKGLEFDTVFLVGLEDGLIPSKQNIEDPLKLEEECRLLYVGITRAIRQLFCSHVDTRMRFGSIMPMDISRFLEDISKDVYRMVDQTATFGAFPASGAGFEHRQVKQRILVGRKKSTNVSKLSQKFDDFSQDTLQYRMGQMVVHKKYGEGKITNISGFGLDMQITIIFKDGNRKKLLAKFANLEHI